MNPSINGERQLFAKEYINKDLSKVIHQMLTEVLIINRKITCIVN
ncbi:hypothetical protein [Lysinibacillus xylanilyticus]